jgi:hypothetical protein
MPNGNLFKGNKKKKGGRKRKEEFADFNPLTDQYAKIIRLEGGKHMTVQPLNAPKGTTLQAIISGKHHKKVWFKKEEIIVISTTPGSNYTEVVGRVKHSELKKVRAKFDELEDNEDNVFDMTDDESDKNDSDEDIDFDEI